MPAEEGACGRSRQQQLRAARVARGRCPRCGKCPPEPGLKLCHGCGEKRRAAERARRAKARTEGKQYGGRDPERCRRVNRDGDRRRRRAWKEAGLCTSCGHRRPEENRSVCEPCRETRRALDRRRYNARRAAGRCVRCTQPTVGGLSRCGRCLALEKERVSPEQASAASKKRYARRRARGECVDCGVHTGGAARCPRCAYRSNSRAPERHLAAFWPPQISVVELETGDELGVFETESEAAACIAFARLRPDQVEIHSNVPLLALSPS